MYYINIDTIKTMCKSFVITGNIFERNIIEKANKIIQEDIPKQLCDVGGMKLVMCSDCKNRYTLDCPMSVHQSECAEQMSGNPNIAYDYCSYGEE